MLSTMESMSDPRRALAAAERAAAAPYVDYPVLRGWYPLAVGLWSAALVASLTLLDSHEVVRQPLVVALLLAEGLFVAWYRRRRGASPSLRGVPPEIAREMALFVVGVVLVLVCVAVVGLVAGALAGVVTTFVLVTAGVAAYERRYAAAAEVVSRRLGPPA